MFLWIALVVIHVVLLAVPIIGWAISIFVNLGALVLWIVLLLKAYQGQKFKLAGDRGSGGEASEHTSRNWQLGHLVIGELRTK